MKILLIGEYSNVHWTLAEGLRALGHDVTVVSDGDVWKGYQRDINLKRKSLGRWDTLQYLWQLHRVWPKLKGYDVVQIINPVFLDLKAERTYSYYEKLRKQNGKMVLGAYGIDHFWVKEGMKPDTFRYSDFYLNGKLRHNHFNDEMIKDWLHGAKGKLNIHVAEDCDAIVTGLYEYDVCYRPYYDKKTTFIPFPINRGKVTPVTPWDESQKVRFFIGIQKARNLYKGTDIMLRALEQVHKKHADKMEIVKAESVPFYEYQELMNNSHVLLDQLYSYTPAMNALNAMAKGMVLVGGGEEEQYELLNEHELRPIVNVQPNLQDVVDELEKLVLNPQRIRQLASESVEYIRRHHDHIQIAKQYTKLYESI